jgi:hypothetical protein
MDTLGAGTAPSPRLPDTKGAAGSAESRRWPKKKTKRHHQMQKVGYKPTALRLLP